jgi:predicted Fe-Mo cluster-binding NifX family protein
MKVCIPTMESNLDSQVSPFFGRAPFLLFFDLDTERVKVFSNPGVQAFRGAGIATSQTVVSEQAKVVIGGNFGPNAFSFLQSSGIKVYQALNLTARQAITKYQKGELEEMKVPTGPSGFPRRGGFGQGRGGRRRGR